MQCGVCEQCVCVCKCVCKCVCVCVCVCSTRGQSFYQHERSQLQNTASCSTTCQRVMPCLRTAPTLCANVSTHPPSPAGAVTAQRGLYGGLHIPQRAGEQGTVSLTVQLSAAATESVTVAYVATGGTATSSDYTLAAGTLTFDVAGQTSKVGAWGV